MRIVGTLNIINGVNYILGTPEGSTEPASNYPLNQGDTIVLAASATLGMSAEADGIQIDPDA